MSTATMFDAKTGEVIPQAVPPPAALSEVTAAHLRNIGEGSLMERTGSLIREGVRHIVEEDADKATITITLTIKMARIIARKQKPKEARTNEREQ